MIPLNKPLINKYDFNSISIVSFLNNAFPQKNINITFSTRQGLETIYKNIYNKYGSLKVGVSPLVCFKALYPIINNNHNIKFIDINPNTFNLDEDKIPTDIDILQLIYLGGNPQNMDKISAFAKKNNILIVEDCAQAFGSEYNNIKLGLWGDYASFNFVKNLYALSGGFILSKDNINVEKNNNLISIRLVSYKKLKRYLETHCSYKNNIYNFLLKKLINIKKINSNQKAEYYSINSTIEKSIIKQLCISEELIEKRILIAQQILNNIKNELFTPQLILPKSKSNFTRLLFKLKDNNCKNIISILRKNGIGANHIIQNTLTPYQEPVFKNKHFSNSFEKEKMQNYIYLHDKIISIPISPALNLNEINYIIDEVNKIHY